MDSLHMFRNTSCNILWLCIWFCIWIIRILAYICFGTSHAIFFGCIWFCIWIIWILAYICFGTSHAIFFGYSTVEKIFCKVLKVKKRELASCSLHVSTENGRHACALRSVRAKKSFRPSRTGGRLSGSVEEMADWTLKTEFVLFHL